MNHLRMLALASLFLGTQFADAQFICAGNNPSDAEIHVKVPKYVYANATYWVPIQFIITGLGQNVKVEPGYQIIFYADGHVISPYPVIQPVFGHDDGLTNVDNGHHPVYTAWIPSASVQNLLLNPVKPVTADCWFQIKGTFTNTDTGQSVPLESPREASAEPLAFSDLHVAVAEIGKTSVFKTTDPTQQFFETSHNAVIDNFLTGAGGPPLDPPKPLTASQLPSYGFNAQPAIAIGVGNNRPLGSSIHSIVSLEGATNFGPSIATVRTQIVSHSVAVYWGNSYDFVIPNLIAPNRGMDINSSSRAMTLNAFPSAVETVSIHGANTPANEFALGDIATAYKVIAFVGVPEEWLAVEAISMLSDAKELIEKVSKLVGSNRSATVNFKLFNFVVAPNGDGKDTPQLAKPNFDTFTPGDDLETTIPNAGYFDTNRSIDVGSTTYFRVEMENGGECEDFGVSPSLDSEATYSFGAGDVTVISH